MIQAGEAEALVDQVRAFSACAEAAGVEVQLSVYEDMVHVWHLMGDATPQAGRAIDEIGAFARKHGARPDRA